MVWRFSQIFSQYRNYKYLPIIKSEFYTYKKKYLNNQYGNYNFSPVPLPTDFGGRQEGNTKVTSTAVVHRNTVSTGPLRLGQWEDSAALRSANGPCLPGLSPRRLGVTKGQPGCCRGGGEPHSARPIAFTYPVLHLPLSPITPGDGTRRLRI